ncbi:hypothetical protein [Streptomyces sp. 2P-4]|uniref:hypothetical protein n=1 Tax=Streptomyces sp. 2P-4 TaxID=2931974 RepID=UPI0025412846|nr:hypothetical protein [Streptomyces sp. 2P-4]
MSETTSVRRRLRPRIAVLLALCLALVGGVGGWLVLGRDTGEPCGGLLRNERLLGAVAAAGGDRPATCAELGASITKATTGGEPGRHTVAQAQAMKTVLNAIPSKDGRIRLDPELRRPLASALADYTADLYITLHSLDATYIINAGAAKPPWEDAEGVHMSVSYNVLLEVLVAVGEDPEAYADIRRAAARHAAEDMVAISTEGSSDSVGSDSRYIGAYRGARVLGSLNAVTASVEERLGGEKSPSWRAKAAEALLAAPAGGPSGSEGGARITSAWTNGLRDAAPAARADYVRDQPVEMVRIWAAERGLAEASRQSLWAETERDMTSGERSAAKSLAH